MVEIMKRRVSLLIMVFFIMTALAGCGKFICGLCGEEKSGNNHKTELLGVEIEICNDCYEELDNLINGE